MDDTWGGEVDDGDLSEDDRARVKAELDPAERLHWLGRPLPRSAPLGRGAAVFATLDALAWIVGIGCVTWTVRGGGPPIDTVGSAISAFIAATIFSVGFIIFFLDRRFELKRLRGTLYVLTDRRAIIWWPSGRAGGVEVHSITWSGVKWVHRSEHPDGSGDLIFQQPNETGAYWWYPRGFTKVPDVVRVERLVREALLSDERT